MQERNPLGVAIVGCGNISRGYAQTMGIQSGTVRLVGAFDVARERAETLISEFGGGRRGRGRAYESLDELLADPQVEAVINLTTYQHHVEITSRCLEAGKHVHSEKPIARDPAEAQQLVALAKRKGVRLSAAPTTFLGEAQQTAAKVLREGTLGQIRVVYAEMNHGRIESWHPAPKSFYTIGPLFDVGVYPVTILTAFLGPVARVSGVGKMLWPERQDQSGKVFHVESPDWGCGILEFESGVIGRLTCSFYVGPSKQHGIEFHGDRASMFLSTTLWSNGSVQVCPFGQSEWTEVPLVAKPYEGIEWARGVCELADAVREGRPQRATGEQAAHVVEIIAGMMESARTGAPVPITSRFTPPQPVEWARAQPHAIV
jgi:predicted dehydrogenase